MRALTRGLRPLWGVDYISNKSKMIKEILLIRWTQSHINTPP